MVEIERWKEPLPPVRAFEPPEVAGNVLRNSFSALPASGYAGLRRTIWST
jgi:hypothetical protein